MDMPSYKNAIKHPIFSIITEAATLLEVEAYVIGGYVRDFLLERDTAKER